MPEVPKRFELVSIFGIPKSSGRYNHKTAVTRGRANHKISGREVMHNSNSHSSHFRQKLCLTYCLKYCLADMQLIFSCTVDILVPWWQVLPKQLLKKSAQPICTAKPCWAKVPLGPTSFLKTLGGHLETC